MAMQAYQSDPHTLEIAVQTVLHKNKAKLNQLAFESKAETVLLNQLAREITVKATTFQRITNRVVRDLGTESQV